LKAIISYIYEIIAAGLEFLSLFDKNNDKGELCLSLSNPPTGAETLLGAGQPQRLL